ncbi:MAG TPA: ABC transporter permease [Nocardioides sp.]
MSAFGALAVAILKGFWRDKASVFFALVFPLMFLVLFGAIFNDTDASKSDLVLIDDVAFVEELEGEARDAFDDQFETRELSREEALEEVRKGDADAALEQSGDELVVHFTGTDQTAAARTTSVLGAFVDAANTAVLTTQAGADPPYALVTEQVEDDSLQMIDYVTPGLLGWAIAMSAAFGAAATLQGWRQSKLLRRLQLAPMPTRTIVGARVVVTLAIALVQTAVFLGLGTAFFGLTLAGNWWMAVPLVVCGTLCFMAMGLLAGAVTKSVEGAVNMANFLVLPMAFLSGSFFPLDEAPGWLRSISLAMPLRHLNDAMMDVMIRGEGAAAVLWPVVIMLGFALVLTAVAAKLFRWET